MLHNKLHKFLSLQGSLPCLEQGNLPTDVRDAVIITLNKRSLCCPQQEKSFLSCSCTLKKTTSQKPIVASEKAITQTTLFISVIALTAVYSVSRNCWPTQWLFCSCFKTFSLSILKKLCNTWHPDWQKPPSSLDSRSAKKRLESSISLHTRRSTAFLTFPLAWLCWRLFTS